MAEMQYMEPTLFDIEHIYKVHSSFNFIIGRGTVVDPLWDKANELFIHLTYFRFNGRSLTSYNVSTS